MHALFDVCCDVVRPELNSIEPIDMTSRSTGQKWSFQGGFGRYVGDGRVGRRRARVRPHDTGHARPRAPAIDARVPRGMLSADRTDCGCDWISIYSNNKLNDATPMQY